MLGICTRVDFATISDAAEISELSQSYIEYGLRSVYTSARIRDLMRNSSKNVVVARKDLGLAGFGIMTYRVDSANLDLLAVKKRYRRRGVGAQVVQWLEKVACTAGIANIFVQARNTNTGAIRFYEKLGFHIIGEAQGYYQGRESAVIMCKGIRPMFCNVRGIETKHYGQ
jgi:[ribosomal protein S18]-alanine N-acetyltransferase